MNQNEANIPGGYVFSNLVNENENLRKNGVYHSIDDGKSTREMYAEDESNELNIQKLVAKEKEYAEKKEYLLGTETKEGLVDEIQRVTKLVEAREDLLADDYLLSIDGEYSRLLKDLEKLEKERDNIIYELGLLENDINYLRGAIKGRNENREQYYRNEINEYITTYVELKSRQFELNRLERILQDVSMPSPNLSNQISSLNDDIKFLTTKLRELELFLLSKRLDFGKIDAMAKKAFEDRNKVTVTFDTRGGSREGVSYDAIQLEKGQTLLQPENPILEGHDFIGWTLYGKPFDFNQPILNDIKLVAQYRERVIEVTQVEPEIETVTVTFDTAGGSREGISYDPIEIEKGQLIIRPANPILDDEHEFECWTLDGEEFDFNRGITEDITLVAQYKELQKTIIVEPEAETVTVTFDTRGGSREGVSYDPIEIEKGQTVTKPADPIIDDAHELECWTLNGEEFDFTQPVTGDITLVAKYREIKKEETEMFTVTFDANGGLMGDSESITVEVEKGQMVISPGDPILEGNEFECWTLNGESYNFLEPVTGDITLVAKYKKLEKKDTATVTFDANGGLMGDSESITIEVEKGQPVAKPADPTLEEREFEGWELDGEPYDFTQPVTGDITLVAKYKKLEKTEDKKKRDWKKIAKVAVDFAIGALGVGVGFGVHAADQLLGGTGLVSSLAGGVGLAGAGAAIYKNFKLKNEDYTPVETENLKGIKKSNAKIKNWLHDRNVMKKAAIFLSGFGATALGNGIYEMVDPNSVLQNSNIIDPSSGLTEVAEEVAHIGR